MFNLEFYFLFIKYIYCIFTRTNLDIASKPMSFHPRHDGNLMLIKITLTGQQRLEGYIFFKIASIYCSFN